MHFQLHKCNHYDNEKRQKVPFALHWLQYLLNVSVYGHSRGPLPWSASRNALRVCRLW